MKKTEKKKNKRGIQEKIAEKWEENRLRTYFVRLFEKYDIRNEGQFISFGKWLVFIILILVEMLVLAEGIERFILERNLALFVGLLALIVVFTLCEGLKLFVVREGVARKILYAVNAVTVCGFTFVSSGTLPLCIYLLSLTEFYIETEKTFPAVVILICGILFYIASGWVYALFISGEILNFHAIIMRSFGAILAFLVHFVCLNIALAFYRQFLRLDRTLKELDESKKELEKAYEAKAELSVLEERQRIAKDIHDTAGHALTTVIMQTENAKRIVEENPLEAKNKIVSANLQAKRALEELRDSVHLLSGLQEGQTLKGLLLHVIQESMDGTNISVRSDIADLEVIPPKRRFIGNALKEGIANGLRHGNATAFWVELKKADGKIEFLLSDNGKGVEISKLKKGFGLTSMQDRVATLGGEVEFRSETGEGFEIYLRLPMDR